MKRFLLLTVLVAGMQMVKAQDTTYTLVITERADKIVATLNITDAAKSTRVRDMIAGQYRHLNEIYNRRDSANKWLKEKAAPGKPDSAALAKIEIATTISTDSLHQVFLMQLSKELNDQQVVQVKDGLTYNVLNVTYNAYLDMIPRLTTPQKAQIMAWLVEAREHAMDGESSNKKHAWFNKYKGRINNYLSKEGYDVRKEEADWQKRIRERGQAPAKN